jgi:hypothetical protein
MALTPLLTADATLFCAHQRGQVQLQPGQDFVRIGGRPVLVEGDLKGRPVIGCLAGPPLTVPCLLTASVADAPSHAAFLRIGGRRACLGTATGRTSHGGTMLVEWTVNAPGQALVRVRG